MSRMHELVDPGKPTTIGVGRLKTTSGKCARCLAAFGRFYNTGASCPRCRLRVCRQCRRDADPDWLCSLCHKLQQVKSSNCLSALDIIKYSIRRAWTINGPPARWSAARKSSEYRLYRSLPSRRRDFLDDEKKPTNESLVKAAKATKPTKQNEVAKKSSIPVFRSRSSKEFEDIRDTPKRSLIPQRYRGSTDDLRRSREDISVPSFIPKLLSPRNKEDKQLPLLSQLKRQDSRDDVRKSQSPQNPRVASSCSGGTSIRLFRRDDQDKSVNSRSESQGHERPSSESPKMTVDESQTTEAKNERPDGCCSYATGESKGEDEEERDKSEEVALVAVAAAATVASGRELDKHRPSEATLLKKTDEPPPVVRRKFSKEELSTDDTDDAHNRRCSSHLSPEASPLSTRSSKYSPRESESEPTPALPRKIVGERGESSLASQRIRDAITRTRRESNSSAKYESSGSEGVRLSESGLSSYVDIARRVKLFSSGSLGASAGSCDEILQRDSATSAGEDDHDEHLRTGPASQSRVMMRRRRQFDAQGITMKRRIVGNTAPNKK